nr:uncharacterized protein LOC107451280 isoform X2 [Parasteatoda tepidariorum]
MPRHICGLALLLSFIISSMDYTFSYPANGISNIRSKRSASDSENPEDIIRVLMKLAQDVILDSDPGMQFAKERNILLKSN